MKENARSKFLLSKVWVQAAVLVVLFGFFVLGFLAYRTYVAAPPIPETVTDALGNVIFTGDDIQEGQELFLSRGLMEYGSIFGHGAYLGPDFTTDYLRRSALSVLHFHQSRRESNPFGLTVSESKENHFDPSTGRLKFTDAQAKAFDELRNYYRAFFSQPETKTGLRSGIFSSPGEIKKLTAFFCWSAWVASAKRPGKEYSYTNNWPPEALVGNGPTGANVVWSVLSLVALLGGIGALLAVFGRWNLLGWHGPEKYNLVFRKPDSVALSPGQRSCAGFFLVMSLLFLLQTLVGGASQHYRAQLSNFFGIDLARLFPFNLARTWHLQLAIFWVATSYLGAGIFIAPYIARNEPPGQKLLSQTLLVALVIVVLGSLAGEFAGIFGVFPAKWSWFGNQGFEYLDLGRFWQILLSVGLFFWVIILFRGLGPRLKREHKGNMPWLFFFAALAIPAFYAIGLLAHPRSTFVITDFWRFWVVHLWVEDFLELFTTIMVAYIFVLLGIVEEKTALRLIYLDIILYSAGGVIGTMHHLYFSGEPAEHMALGAFFSAAEVIPLTFLTVEAWSFLQLGSAHNCWKSVSFDRRSQLTPAVTHSISQSNAHTEGAFPHKWAVLFLAAVGFWNFVGAGIFGFLINLPIVSYYEIGTALTANHGHAAMMGVYGMLSIGLALFALRYLIPEHRWSDRAAKISFWSLNLGLAWMVFVVLFPLGVMQLYESVTHGYFEARELHYLMNPANTVIQWLRFPGDALFIAGGVLPLIYLCWRGVFQGRPAAGVSAPDFLLSDPRPAPEEKR